VKNHSQFNNLWFVDPKIAKQQVDRAYCPCRGLSGDTKSEMGPMMIWEFDYNVLTSKQTNTYLIYIYIAKNSTIYMVGWKKSWIYIIGWKSSWSYIVGWKRVESV